MGLYMADFAVESHPQRLHIDAMLLSGLTLKKISESVTPPVTPMSLSRYKRAQLQSRVTPKDPKSVIISEISANAVSSEPASIPAQPSTLRALVDRLADRQERALDRAEAAVKTVEVNGELRPVGDDLKVLAPMFRERLNSIRLLGELTGELNQASAQAASITINIVASPAAASSPYDLEVTAEPMEIGVEAGTL